MRIDQLIDGFELELRRASGGDAGMAVTDLTDDSRQVTPGCLFIARSDGGTDGRCFIEDAVARGAAAVITEQPEPAPPAAPPPPAAAERADVVWIVGRRVDQMLAGRLADRFFGHPCLDLALIGVTGTNGKTTTAYLTQHLLRQAGVKTGLIGTIAIDEGDDAGPRPATLTTPGAIDFVRHLAAMVRRGCRAAVAEVSSHALHQGRTAALRFHAAVFTNLTGDHLDYHHTMDAYADAKAMLFEQLPGDGWAIVNDDDAWSPRMLRDFAGGEARTIPCTVRDAVHAAAAPPQQPVIRPDLKVPATRDEGFATDVMRPANARACRAAIVSMSARASTAVLDGAWGSFEIEIPMIGRHNVSNALQAAAAASTVVDLSRTLRKALREAPAVPGRLQHVAPSAGEPGPTVLVDYAHTHDALENVLHALRPVTRGRLIAMFGCGGDRDRTKRPKMAAAACAIADAVVITSDNPRTEDPQRIIDDIVKGVPAAWRRKRRGDRLIIEPDRAAAIAQAIAMSDLEDVVLLAGKGHEDYQIIGTTKRHFDDAEHAAEALRQWTPRLQEVALPA